MPRTDKHGAGQHGADEHGVEELFRTRYLEMVRLAGLLGADDPEDIAQEAFTRLMRRRLPEPQAALGYLRAIVVNLTRNRHRHLRVVRMRTPAAVAEGSSEQAAILREDHREVIAALAGLPPPARGHRPALLAGPVGTRDRRGHGDLAGNREIEREPPWSRRPAR